MDSHEHHGDEIFMVGPHVVSEGLCTRAMGACFGCDALFKNAHSTQASGDTFCYSVGAPSVSELRRSGRSRGRGGQVDGGDADRYEGGGGLVTGELCQRESEGQNLHLFLSGHSKP